ncbi:hypothetical protein HAX54_050821 [Datura stramonium]|uniref:non-specific serine/threonine protein kinase n=1 Tax=Datura stramonium TaxID=4076 RepID=A0ABS8WPM8_DATST|nr:hypothetical protein [Datura stramonium]
MASSLKDELSQKTAVFGLKGTEFFSPFMTKPVIKNRDKVQFILEWGKRMEIIAVNQGKLINGTPVAIKKLLNNLGQAEKEFQVGVEAIGHVRHKNLVRLLGYCIEGTC